MSEISHPEDLTSGSSEILEVLFDSEGMGDEGIQLGALYGLQSHMRRLLRNNTDRYDYVKSAISHAEGYRSDMDMSLSVLAPEQQSALVLARVYMSSISALGHMWELGRTRNWSSRHDSIVREIKSIYLGSRKQLQTDIGDYFEHFSKEPTESTEEVLQGTVDLAHLIVADRIWRGSIADTYMHMFLGSVLSEYVVVSSLQEHVHAGTRYGTVEEDLSPTKADVVLPLEQGDVHMQVKMRWQKPSKLHVRPRKNPPAIVVPMHVLRSTLTEEEHARLSASVIEVADRLAA